MRSFLNRLIKVSQIPAILVATLMVINGLIDTGIGLLYLLDLSTLSNFFARYPSFVALEPIAQTNTLLTIFFGWVLIILGIGLYKRRRIAWLIALFVLAAQFFNNTFLEFKFNLSILSGLSLFILITSQRLFYIRGKKLSYTQITAWFAIIFALAYGIIGTYLLRNQFSNIHSLIDSVYYTIVTFSTVGYGDIVPITHNAKFFVTTMIIVGLGSFAIAISALVAPLIERELKGVFYMMNKISNLHNHIVICGYNSITKQIIDSLVKAKQSYVLIEEDPDSAKMAEELGLHILIGSSNSIATLKKANVLAAKTVLCLENSDAENILIAMTLNDYFKQEEIDKPLIVAKIDEEENIIKAKRVGIDQTFSPNTLSSVFVLSQLN